MYESSDELDLQLTVSETNYSALHLAVASADLDTVNAIVSFGAAVTASAHHGIQPIHIAAYLRLPKILDMLLSKGATLSNASSNLPLLHSICSISRPDLLEGVINALSCVAWLEDVQVSPQLMEALAHSVSEGELSSKTTTRVAANSPLIQKAIALQQLRCRQKLLTSISWCNTGADRACGADHHGSGDPMQMLGHAEKGVHQKCVRFNLVLLCATCRNL